MHKTRLLIFGLGTLVVITTTLNPSPVFACKPHEIVEYKGVSASCVAKCAESEAYITIAVDNSHCVTQANGIYVWLLYIIRFLSAGVGIAVTGGIVWGGLLRLTARDNAAQVQKATTVITNSVVGLVLYLLMFAILNFLIPGGVLR